MTRTQRPKQRTRYSWASLSGFAGRAARTRTFRAAIACGYEAPIERSEVRIMGGLTGAGGG
jgi:hypothetical protein